MTKFISPTSVFGVIRKITNFMAMFCFVIVVSVVFSQVIARHVLGSSIKWADEVSRFAFVWLVYIGGAITIRESMNVCFDLILESVVGFKRKILFTIVNIASVMFLVFMIYLGIKVSQSMATEVSSILSWPMSIVTLAVPIGGSLMLLEQIIYFFENLNDPNYVKGGNI